MASLTHSTGRLDSISFLFIHCVVAWVLLARRGLIRGNFNIGMRYRIQFVVFLGWSLLSAITAQAQFFYSDTVNIQFAPAKVPDGVTWSPSVSLRDGGLSSEKLPPNMAAEVWVQSQPISAGMS